MNAREAYFAMFALLIAISNIFFIIFNADAVVLQIFSFALSIATIYFAFLTLIELDIINQIKMIMVTHVLGRTIEEAWDSVVKEAKDAKESKD